MRALVDNRRTRAPTHWRVGSDVAQHLLVPRESDPPLWAIRVKVISTTLLELVPPPSPLAGALVRWSRAFPLRVAASTGGCGDAQPRGLLLQSPQPRCHRQGRWQQLKPWSPDLNPTTWHSQCLGAPHPKPPQSTLTQLASLTGAWASSLNVRLTDTPTPPLLSVHPQCHQAGSLPLVHRSLPQHQQNIGRIGPP